MADRRTRTTGAESRDRLMKKTHKFIITFFLLTVTTPETAITCITIIFHVGRNPYTMEFPSDPVFTFFWSNLPLFIGYWGFSMGAFFSKQEAASSSRNSIIWGRLLNVSLRTSPTIMKGNLWFATQNDLVFYAVKRDEGCYRTLRVRTVDLRRIIVLIRS